MRVFNLASKKSTAELTAVKQYNNASQIFSRETLNSLHRSVCMHMHTFSFHFKRRKG